MSSSITLIAGIGAATIATSALISKWAASVTATISPLLHMSTNTATAIETIQELGFAASVSGSSIDDMNSSIEGLSRRIGEAAQKGSEDFSRLGVNVRKANGEVKSTEQVLFEVGRRFNELNLSQAERLDFAEKLGINKSSIQLITKSSDAIAKLRKQARDLGIVTREQAEDAEKLNDSLFVLGFAFDSIQRSIAVGLAPEMSALTDGFTDFLIENKDLIQNGLSAVITVITELSAAMVRLAPVFGVVLAGFVAMKVAALGFAGVMGIILSPVILITAAIAAMILVVDDLIVGFSGGDSVIGNWFDSMFGLDIFEKIQGFIDLFLQLTTIVGEFARSGFAEIAEFLGAEGITIDAPDISISAGDASIRAGEIGSSVSNSINTTISQDVSIEIKTNDPVAAGEAVSDSLQSQLEDSRIQANMGGA